jgi:hypothetical protein
MHVMKITTKFEISIDLSLLISTVNLVVSIVAWLLPAR